MQHNIPFTWADDVIGAVEPTDSEREEMSEAKQISKSLALLETGYGYGLTTLNTIPKYSAFLYVGEIKDLKNYTTTHYAIVEKGTGKYIDAEQKRGYMGFAQHLFQEKGNYRQLYKFTPEDESNIAIVNISHVDRFKTGSHRQFFYAHDNILPLDQIGYDFATYYFKLLSIPMAPFSLVDGFPLNYQLKGYEMSLIYHQFQERFEINVMFDEFFDPQTNLDEIQESLIEKRQELENLVGSELKQPIVKVT